MSYRADRYWWAYVSGVLVVGVIAAAVAAIIFAQLFEGGISASAIGQIIMAAFSVLIALVYALFGIIGRKRWRLRQLAIKGDLLAIPESTIALDVAGVFDVSRYPLVMPWRATAPFGQLFQYGFLCVNVSMYLVVLLAPLAERIWSPAVNSPFADILAYASGHSFLVILLWIPVFFIIALIPATALPSLKRPMMVFAFSPLVEYPYLVAGVFSGCAFLGVAYFALSLVNERRFQASRICVTSDGIERFSVLGRRRALAWHDAHLLEVSSRRYAPYGSGAVVRWEVPVIRSGTLPRFWQIAPAVRLHTGLLPRTLNPDTLAPNASLDYARLAYVVARLPLWLFVATMILTFTQVDLTFVKGIVIPIGIGSSVWLVRFAARRWLGIVRPSDRQSTVPTSLPTLDSGAVYEMAVGSHSAFLFNQVLFVVLGLAAIGFSVFILGTQFAQFVLRVPGLHFYALPPAVMLFPVSLMGFGIALRASTGYRPAGRCFRIAQTLGDGNHVYTMERRGPHRAPPSHSHSVVFRVSTRWTDADHLGRKIARPEP